ncbi:hypothetical protein RRG08_025985 [Elysia crispata]|uniref:Uncharacterized protein n=1 Tax=Elysia crispata TaxID=231223 RepID=A0AAE0ZG80_9GAST|nr:hypothetical protein RRG08_025985 [Elysia crispata]
MAYSILPPHHPTDINIKLDVALDNSGDVISRRPLTQAPAPNPALSQSPQPGLDLLDERAPRTRSNILPSRVGSDGAENSANVVQTSPHSRLIMTVLPPPTGLESGSRLEYYRLLQLLPDQHLDRAVIFRQSPAFSSRDRLAGSRPSLNSLARCTQHFRLVTTHPRLVPDSQLAQPWSLTPQTGLRSRAGARHGSLPPDYRVETHEQYRDMLDLNLREASIVTLESVPGPTPEGFIDITN